MIGGAILACLGVVVTIVRGAVIAELILMPGGLAAFVALLVSALALSIFRAWVEWRRRKAGRPRLRITNPIFGITVVSIAALVAGGVGIIALVATLATAPSVTSLLFAVGTNLLFGYIWIMLSMRTLRDVLLLVQVGRDRSPSSSSRTRSGIHLLCEGRK